MELDTQNVVATKGEKSIRLWLEKNNIIFDEQARASAHFNDSLFIQDIERTFMISCYLNKRL